MILHFIWKKKINKAMGTLSIFCVFHFSQNFHELIENHTQPHKMHNSF